MATEELERPGFWAVIPARVRYDDTLRPAAKLIYAEISALTNAHGYCWATNKWFAERYQLTPKTVSELIASLARAGYVRIDEDARRGNADRRKIYLEALSFTEGGIPKNRDTPSPEKSGDPYPEKSGDGIPKNREQNNINNNTTPIVPKGERPAYIPPDVFRAIGESCGGDAELMAAWMAYAEMRHRVRHPIVTVITVRRAVAALERISGGDLGHKLYVLKECTDRAWRGIYEPKDAPYRAAGYRDAEKGVSTWT